ncbi:MAG: hypothetical protein M1482_00360, partial [Chloroflexi bacterium]|nr:hypothetical protein [Chloroflexota bacterium]
MWYDDEQGWRRELLDVSWTTDSKDRSIHRYVKICVKCRETFSIQPCRNCEKTTFQGASFREGPDGIVCWDCKTARQWWKCGSCGTRNPYEGRVFRVDYAE